MAISLSSYYDSESQDSGLTVQGETGFTGSIGYTGSQGDTGFTGSQGDTGFTGSQGDLGYTGSQGDIGYTGSQGDTGFTGSQGDLGYTGSQGDIGYTGSQGDTGFTGSSGYTGSRAFDFTDESITGTGTELDPYSVAKIANPVDISVSGAVSGNVSFDGSQNVEIQTSFEPTYSFSTNLVLSNNWIDTGISSTDMETGTYVMQLFINDERNFNETLTGIMSWYTDTTNPDSGFTSDEIPLHRSGEKTTSNVYLRTFRSALGNGGELKLQIYSTEINNNASDYFFKFKKIL